MKWEFIQMTAREYSMLDKIFDKILCQQLTKLLEKYQVFYAYQFGFRKHHSTVKALIEFTENIICLFDEKNYVLCIFIDFTKAFDTVNHETLLSGLEHCGAKGHWNDFFRSYLTNNHQYTLVNGVKSKLQSITCDVPQGSVLVFILYINDIWYILNKPNAVTMAVS